MDERPPVCPRGWVADLRHRGHRGVSEIEKLVEGQLIYHLSGLRDDSVIGCIDVFLTGYFVAVDRQLDMPIYWNNR